MFYLVKTPWVVKKFLYPDYIWSIPSKEKKIYLSFDDGPHPTVTPFVLDQLNQYNAEATFFCIGKNIEKHSEIFNKILDNGHALGNHTFNHFNGWKTKSNDYLKNVDLCNDKFKDSQIVNLKFQIPNSFRPPYGKIKPSQSKKLRQLGYKIIMWDILTADFDQTISKQQCLENATKKVTSGSIIVFHDSKKAFKNLEYALPKAIEILKEKGYQFDTIQ